MPSRPLPNLLLQAFFDLGEDGWKDDMDLNLLKLSVLTQAGASEMVSEEPADPAAGTIIVLDETHATHPNAIAVFDDGEWVYFTPTEGWMIYNRDTSTYLSYNATAWVEMAAGGGGGGGGGGDTSYRVGFFWTSAPVSSEVLLIHVFTDPVTFADDFAGAVGYANTNPAATFTLDVQKNGVSVGSIAISTTGVFTFTTTSGAVAFAAGDRLRVVGPAVAGTAASVGITFKGVIG